MLLTAYGTRTTYHEVMKNTKDTKQSLLQEIFVRWVVLRVFVMTRRRYARKETRIFPAGGLSRREPIR